MTCHPVTRADPAHRRRDQAGLQPDHPNLADHPPLPALVLVAAPPPSPGPLVSPASSPAAASSRCMIRSRSTAALLGRSILKYKAGSTITEPSTGVHSGVLSLSA